MPLTRQSVRAISYENLTRGPLEETHSPLPQVTYSLPDAHSDESHRNLKASGALSSDSSRLSAGQEELRNIELEELELEMKAIELRRRRLMVRKEPSAGPESPAKEFDSCGAKQSAMRRPYVTTRPGAINSILSTISLPRIEIDKYDGTPTKFCKFMKSFNMCVGDKVEDNEQRLMYLIHYCCGAAKDAIEHCVLLPGDTGYPKAIEILKNQFGRPHDIAETFLAELLNSGNIQPNDIEGLRKLVRLMINCEIALSGLNYVADLNCSTNIRRIVQRLPKPFQHKWAEAADDILCTGSEPTFRHLVEFLEKRLSVATNCYGQAASGNRRVLDSSDQQTNIKQNLNRSYVNATIQHRPASCPLCSQDHRLTSCPDFRSKDHNERLAFLKNLKLCFNCFKPNHRAMDCRSDLRCGEPGCSRRHHRLIHLAHEATETLKAKVNAMRADLSASYLGFIPVRLVGPKGCLLTYAFLDNGSDSTLLLRKAADFVGLKGTSTQLEVSSISGIHVTRSSKVNLSVESLEKDYRLDIDSAYTVDQLPVTKAKVPSNENIAQWPHLQGIRPPRIDCDQVSLLIGTNVPEAHWVLDQRVGTSRQPYASLSVLGWVLFGPASHRPRAATTVCCLEAREPIETKPLEMFEIDFNERKKCDENSMSDDDKLVLDSAHRSTTLEVGHYQVRLPWKTAWRNMPENRYIAEGRLSYLRKRHLKDDDLLRCHHETITSHEAKSYVNRVSRESSDDHRFVPHHPLMHPHKPEKVRIVVDCASKTQGVSLNDCLHSRPNLSKDLTGVLLLFRLHTFGLSVNIEGMFLQVRLPQEDSRPLSLLWHPKGDLNAKSQVYQWSVHPFGATPSPFCDTFALRKTASNNRGLFDRQASTAIKKNFYVDDCLVSVETTPAAIRLTDQLGQLAAKGGVRLHKRVSISDAVLSSIPQPERSCESIRIGQGDLGIQRVLGKSMMKLLRAVAWSRRLGYFTTVSAFSRLVGAVVARVNCTISVSACCCMRCAKWLL